MEKNMNFKEILEQKVSDTEAVLRRYLPKKEGSQVLIMEAMEYSLLAGGKRLRPMLMQETYRLYGGCGKVVEPFMAAIEMIHTYSLVHDDLPAMDNDEYRRGRKTTHVVYGEDIAILAGDALLNYAFETAAGAFSDFPNESEKIANALQILAKKAGIFGMIGGQVIDVQNEGKSVTRELLDTINRLKTGALIESAMMIGAVLAGASEKEIMQVEKAAADIGMAFQIQDDILDVTGTSEVLGKPVGSDEKNDKTTYVTLMGIEEAKKRVEQLSDEAVSVLSQTGHENPFLTELVHMLIYREK